MPSRKAKDGTYRDIAHPINNEMRKKIEDAVISEYKKKLAESETAEGEAQEEEAE